MNKKGFTLAEVLMVLAIIGVIAAMTIPAVLSSTRGKEHQTAAQKALSTLNSGMNFRYALETESMEDYENSIGAYLTREIEDTEKRVMVGSKVQGGTGGECATGAGACKVETQDGMTWSFPGGKTSGTQANECSSTNGCLVWVDTNGLRGPSRGGVSDVNTKCSGKNITTTEDNANASGGDNIDTVEGNTIKTNKCPDLIALRIKNRNVEPADTRTRNILTTGRSNVSQ